MQVTLGLLADAANFSDNGKLNLLGAFQAILLKEVPSQYPLFVLIAIIRGNSSEKGTKHQFSIELTDEEARLVYDTSVFTALMGSKTAMPYAEVYLMYNIQNLIFPRFGLYKFHIVANEKRIHSIDLLVQPVVHPHLENANEQG